MSKSRSGVGDKFENQPLNLEIKRLLVQDKISKEGRLDSGVVVMFLELGHITPFHSFCGSFQKLP